jgi:hypothetical protein
MTQCTLCGKQLEKEIRNLEQGFSSKCHCQRLGARAAYGVARPLTKTLGTRYNAMMQRCYKDTHVSSYNYKMRGIQVLFKSRRDFVTWALEKWPEETFKKKDFDRIDNDGHYSKENLRLVDRRTNLLNRRRPKDVDIQTARDFMARHPEVNYTATTCYGLFRLGMSEDQILERHRNSSKAGWRKSGSTTS